MRGGEMLSPIAGQRWERDGKYDDKMLDKPGGGHYNISVAMRQYEPLAQPAEHLTFNQRARGSNPRWFTKRKRRPKASFSFWCGRWDLNPHVIDTRTSNVPVCRFQHFRIALYYYTILFPVVKTVSRQTPSKIRIKFRGQRGLTFWNHYEVF